MVAAVVVQHDGVVADAADDGDVDGVVTVTWTLMMTTTCDVAPHSSRVVCYSNRFHHHQRQHCPQVVRS